jgi:thiamine-phosphate pyrophosphorylase
MAERCVFCYITDRLQFPGNESEQRRAALEKMAEAARAGVDYIQLREKDLSPRELESLARAASRIVREQRTATDLQSATRLLINSRTDISLAAGADGVHLRSDDILTSDVRSIWANVHARDPYFSSLPLVAVSCHTAAEVESAASDGADFAVFGPVFEKGRSQTVGLAALQEACKAKVPVLALGGVTLQNAGACLDAGAAGIAGIRLFQENSIHSIVRALSDR